MNLFELMFFIAILGGACGGGVFFYSAYGVWGAVIGALLGGCAGYLIMAACMFLLAVVFTILWGGPLFAPRKAPEDDGPDGEG